MRIAVIGAGAMGGTFGGLLSRQGHDVTLIDIWREHVAAINASGLHLEGVNGEHRIRIRALEDAGSVEGQELAIVFTDANSTAAAARTAKRVLSNSGVAITFQNGIGNIETLVAELGAARVLGGSSMNSAAVLGPGHIAHTHRGVTSAGELDGKATARLDAIVRALNQAGLETKAHTNIMGQVWTKFVLNCAINPLCATTQLRLGEIVRLPELSALQDRVLEELLAVVKAKKIELTDPDIHQSIKKHCWRKYSKPSMFQHVEQGKQTEIDALNGALVREAKALGVPTPYNESVVALLKGVEKSRQQTVRGPKPDYTALEAAVGPMP
jgi:2-dehydropantoate 2-reductase